MKVEDRPSTRRRGVDGKQGMGSIPSTYARDTILAPVDERIDVSVIIVNWNTVELLRACLDSILQTTSRERVEIIVVDNGSRDGSAQMVACDFPTVCLVANTVNKGFAVANNQGLSRAHGRYMLLLNSDTIVQPQAIEEMVRYMDAQPRVGALGPRLLHGDGSLQVSVRNFPSLDHDAATMLEVKRWPVIGNVARRRLQQNYLPDPARTQEVDWVMGACLLLRREALEQVGLLDEAYYFFYEDVDLCYRLRRQGWVIVFLGSAQVVHLGGQTRTRVSAPSLGWYYKGLLRFYHLHASPARYIALRIGVTLGAAGHIVWLLLRHWRRGNDRLLLAAYARILVRAAAG